MGWIIFDLVIVITVLLWTNILLFIEHLDTLNACNRDIEFACTMNVSEQHMVQVQDCKESAIILLKEIDNCIKPSKSSLESCSCFAVINETLLQNVIECDITEQSMDAKNAKNRCAKGQIDSIWILYKLYWKVSWNVRLPRQLLLRSWTNVGTILHQPIAQHLLQHLNQRQLLHLQLYKQVQGQVYIVWKKNFDLISAYVLNEDDYNSKFDFRFVNDDLKILFF